MERAKLLPAALAGFHLIGRAPIAALVWGLIYFLVGTLPILFVSHSMFGFVAGVLADPSAEPPPEAVGGLLLAMLAIPVALIGMLIAAVVICTAIWRAVLFPEQRGFAYMRFGRTEGRVFLIGLILYALFYVASIVPSTLLMLPVMPMMFGPMMELSQLAEPSVANIMDMYLAMLPAYGVMFALQLVVYAALAWPFARLALALPMSVAEDRMRVFEGWSFSRGYGWSLWGMVMLVWIGVSVVEYAWFGALTWWALGPFDPAAFGDPALVLERLSERAPVFVGALAASLLVISIVGFPIVLAPLARAHQLIAEDRRRRAPSV